MTDSIDEESQNDCRTVGNASLATTILKKRKLRWYLRLLILALAGIVGLFLCGVVFYAGREGEKEAFQVVFDELSGQVVSTLASRFERKLADLDSLSIAITSHGIDTNATWPNVTLPDFNLRAESLTSTNDDTLGYLYAPFVDEATVASWEAFSVLNANHLTNGDDLGEPPSETVYGTRGSAGTIVPVWQHFPISVPLINFDLMSIDHISSEATTQLFSSEKVVTGSLVHLDTKENGDELTVHLSHLAAQQGFNRRTNVYATNVFYPVFDSFLQNKALVGLTSSEMIWNAFFSNIIPLGENDELLFVLRDGCGSTHTFKARDSISDYVGEGDWHDAAYDHMEQDMSLSLLEWQGLAETDSDFCSYSIKLFPTKAFEREYVTFKPILYTAAAAIVLAIIVVMSIAYERRVEQMNENAVEYRAIVANIFPAVVRDRLFRRRADERTEREKAKKAKKRGGAKSNFDSSQRTRTARFLDDLEHKDSNDGAMTSKPVADLYPNATVMFADIAGFTEWSSNRKPEQVFTLLQVLFNEFDRIARKRRVFKVETIGDCYMACTGLPSPQRDHALRMVAFARDCLSRVDPILARLQRDLGPETRNLAMRFGMHSGPVTAGVLVGERARFQLFGDTVNTASRMESTGIRNRIQLSPSTAQLLINAGKLHWIQKREDPVQAKGKGEIHSYWALTSRHTVDAGGEKRKIAVASNAGEGRPPRYIRTSAADSDFQGRIHSPTSTAQHYLKAEAWNRNMATAGECKEELGSIGDVDGMGGLDKRRARRSSLSNSISSRISETEQMTLSFTSISGGSIDDTSEVSSPFGVANTIPLKDLPNLKAGSNDAGLVDWHVEMLGSYLKEILLQRRQLCVVGRVENPGTAISRGTCVLDEFSETIPIPTTASQRPKEGTDAKRPQLTRAVELQLQDFVSTIARSYRQNPFHNFARATHVAMFCRKFLLQIGRRDLSPHGSDLALVFNSDPLLRFSIHFAALIHDMGHLGVSNEQLAKEDPELAEVYAGRLISQQHSVDLGWELLMDSCYSDLQNCIFATKSELNRFRQIVVNLVLSSGLGDKEMNTIRALRWNEAFSSPVQIISGGEKKRHQVALLAESLLQLADVSCHCQDWKTFLRWTRNGFFEASTAHRAGRSATDPDRTWHAFQLSMFDSHVIPLLQKLQKTNIMTCDELLKSAAYNRRAWKASGATEVRQFLSKSHESQAGDDIAMYCHESNNSSYRFVFGDEGDGFDTHSV